MSAFRVGVDSDFPDQVCGSLQRGNHSKQLCAAISTPATLMAVGCSDGAVAIYDFETRAVAKLLRGHTKPVVALSWSASSHHLLSASLEGHVIRWNVLAGTQGSYATLSPPIAQAYLPAKRRIKSIQLHPHIADVAILNFSDSDHPLLLELDPLPADAPAEAADSSPVPTLNGDVNMQNHSLADAAPRHPIWSRYISTPFASHTAAAATAAPSSTPPDTPAPPAPAAPADGTDAAAATPAPTPTASVTPPTAVSTGAEDPSLYYTRWHSTVAIFDRTGRFIFEGNSKGTVFIYQLQYDAARHAEARAARQAQQPQQQQRASTTLPPYLSLRLVYVEVLPGMRRSRAPASAVQSIVHSGNGAFLLVNVATQLKLYAVDTSMLLNRSPNAEETLAAMAAHCATDPDTLEVVANGARYLPPEKPKQRKSGGKVDPALSGMSYNERRKARKEREQLQRERQQQKRQQAKLAAKEEEENGGAEDAADNDEEKDEDEHNSDGEDEAGDRNTADGSTPAGASSSRSFPPLLDYLRTLSDQVNRVPWRSSAFSHSSDFIYGGSAERGEHRIHVWSLLTGQLTKLLLGPTEGLLHLEPHPTRPTLVTCCTSGTIYIWSKKYVENWSAFAPDFEELDDNQEYVEREDEFDLIEAREQKSDDPEDVFVDIAAEEDGPGAAGEGGAARVSIASSSMRVGIPPLSEQLVALPTTILLDADTAAAYQVRRALAMAKREEQRQADAAAATPEGEAKQPLPVPAGADVMVDVAASASVSTPQGHKRALEASPASSPPALSDVDAKRARV